MCMFAWLEVKELHPKRNQHNLDNSAPFFLSKFTKIAASWMQNFKKATLNKPSTDIMDQFQYPPHPPTSPRSYQSTTTLDAKRHLLLMHRVRQFVRTSPSSSSHIAPRRTLAFTRLPPRACQKHSGIRSPSPLPKC